MGEPKRLVDAQIAAIAALCDLTLVTRNVSDFEPFRDLKARDWTKARRQEVA
jgi:predicted nucleic acid-binding protein